MRLPAAPTLVSGDANGNNILETTETWTYTRGLHGDAGRARTPARDLVNMATVDTDQTAPGSDDATVHGGAEHGAAPS